MSKPVIQDVMPYARFGLEAVIAVFHASGGARPIADGRSAAFVGVEKR
jgi:hypothetical protein